MTRQRPHVVEGDVRALAHVRRELRDLEAELAETAADEQDERARRIRRDPLSLALRPSANPRGERLGIEPAARDHPADPLRDAVQPAPPVECIRDEHQRRWRRRRFQVRGQRVLIGSAQRARPPDDDDAPRTEEKGSVSTRVMIS